jgi:hypothetical protein
VQPELLGGSDWSPPYRLARIRELILNQNRKLTVQDVEKMHGDVKSLAYFDFLPAFNLMRIENLSPTGKIKNKKNFV